MGKLMRVALVLVALVAGGAGYYAGTSNLLGPQRAVAADECQSFPQTGKQVCGRFLEYWRANGGLAQQGLPLSDPFDERSDVNGQTYKVQYFERARFEYHPENQAPYDVLLGLLGGEQYRVKYPAAPPPPFPGDPFNNPAYPQECADFAQTGQRVCSLFLAYWRANGGLAQQGLPLTGVIFEANPTDGKTYPTQYFERARFEYHEEIVDPQYKVLLGLLGREQFLAKYPGGTPTTGTSPTPSARPTATALVPQPSAAPPTPSQPAPSLAPTATATPTPRPAADPRAGCDPSYPTICVPPPPPDLDCGQIPFRNFPVNKPDPHKFDTDGDGVGCESR
ncbi:MAG TPA: hypothetical protein VIL85_08840 [Thermomicrobiales bacterium]|jgi:hypothetical protein